MRTLKPLLLSIFLAGLLTLSVTPASAHASLVSATPGVNESLERAPVLIELFFSEPVEGNFSAILVFDATGKRVDNDDAAVAADNPLRMTVTVRSLPDGIYTVSWKALSLVDSHVTAGAYPFAVGEVDPAALAAAAASQSTSLSVGEIIFRWTSYLANALLTGGILFIVFAWMPAEAEIFGRRSRGELFNWRKLAMIGLIVLLAANVLGLLFQTGQVVGQEIAAPWNPAITKLLYATRYGGLWLIRFVMALVAARFLLHAKTSRDYTVSFTALLVIMFTFSLNSHAAAEPKPFFPILADWLHLIAASFWVGGLFFLLGGLVSLKGVASPQRTRFNAVLIPKFTRLAMFSVGIMTVSGVYSAVLRLGAWDALTGTLYGRVLLVKSLLALPMLMLGALNFLHTTPALRRAAQQPEGDLTVVERFRLLVSAEVTLGIAIMLAAGIFTAIPPARAASTARTLADAASEGDLSIALQVTPGNVGMNEFRVELEDGGDRLADAREVSLRLIPVTVDLPPIEVILENRGDGSYTAQGAFLSLPDTWQMQVSVRREGEFDTFANFEFPVGTSASATFPWNRLAAILLLAGAVLYLLTLQRLNTVKARERWVTQLPAVSLLVIAVFVFYLQLDAGERYINPIPPNQSSIAQGEAIYRVQCIACHGPSGRGDGPVGLTLNPPPADLYLHTQPGIHPDGRLYEWITFGFADNQVMPRFRQILTDEERWHVVNYIRTFSREGETEQP
jgi:copper transport protein